MRILHCHSTFAAGGKEARAVRLMNVFGSDARHTILTAVPGALAARALIDPAIDVAFPEDAPALNGTPGLARYARLARYMQAFDLVLTYNWGAMDAVMTRRLFGRGLPPLIHHEDGFNADEAARLNPKRNAFRRIALGTVAAVVVPSAKLERIARDVWKQPASRVRRIPNGIDVAAYGAPTVTIPGLRREPGDVIVGTLAGLRAVKNLPRLVRAVAPLPNVRLVIVGTGDQRDAILREAAAHGMADRLVMPGHIVRPQDYIGHFDIFALSSDSEQFPISLIEAMAAGLPCVATDFGDVATMVSAANRPLVVAPWAFDQALKKLSADPDLRQTLGIANQLHARAEYGEDRMIDAYRTLYEGAVRDS